MSEQLPLLGREEQGQRAEAQIQERAKRIEYFITEYSIELLADKMKSGEYVVPEYQREFVWEEHRKWRFIESIIMGLPIPFLFFWEDPASGKLEIVDGSQRLRTIKEFLFDGLVLQDLEKLDALNDLSFADLPESRQRKIKNRSIRGIVLSAHADEQSRFDLFERINTGSKVANKAEVRRGALRGPFLDLVIELARDPLFVNLAPVSPKQEKQREREELVTRFFAYGDGLEEYAEEPSPFLYAYSKRMNTTFEGDPGLATTYKDWFFKVMQFVAAHFPHGFRRTLRGKVTPRVRFEAIAVGTSLALKERPDLQVPPEKVLLWLDDSEFGELIRSDAANVMKKVTGRLNFVRNRLLQDAA